ncbi:SpoIIE family protein phosphatase [Methylomarinum sp. Ch1-1]|uniref:SpoIIE family protein phosphatase n=1 Tax=Methylomarinum roseum TaxID=3067653 RepID=A0AAU7NYB3_9GAMM
MKTKLDNSLKILIAEDNRATIALLVKFLQRQGHTLLLAKDGRQALDLYRLEQPDVVLTDINMPIVNGLEVIEQMRRWHADTWVPIIILSAYIQEEDIINGLKAGADDYMTKPVNLNILSAKIQSIRHFVYLQRINQQTALSLSEAHRALENEQRLAKSLLDKMLDLGDLDYPGLQYWLCPSTRFSGDLIAATRTIGGKLYLMLADATGHGLTAALPTLLIARTFHAMSDKGFTLPSMLVEMNRNAKKYLTKGHAIAAALFAIDFDHQTIEYWNGGLPDALLIDDEGRVMQALPSSHQTIGLLDRPRFNTTTRLLHWEKPCELIGYTDGLADVRDQQGNSFDRQALVGMLCQHGPGQRVNVVKNRVQVYLQGGGENDDISLFALRCGLT